MRRILVGLEVVRPRCAAGAPPRPRLAVHRPINMERGSEINNVRNSPNGSTFTGVPNTDKGVDAATEAASDDVALGTVTWVLAHVLLDRGAEGDGQRGLELLEQVRDMFLHQGFPLSELPMMNLYAAREEVRGGGLDSASRRPPVRREGASRLPRSPSCRQNRFPTPQFTWLPATFHLIPVSP